MMLTHANLNVYATDLGEEGVDLAKLYDYDLILLDLDLPDMDGHEVLRQLRLSRVDTPILILTGSDDTESKIKGFGFVNLFGSSEDVFVHMEVLRAYGMAELAQGEAICVRTAAGPRGRMAIEIRAWDYEGDKTN